MRPYFMASHAVNLLYVRLFIGLICILVQFPKEAPQCGSSQKEHYMLRAHDEH